MANTINKYVWLINQLEAKGRMTHKQLSEAWMESGMADEKQREQGLSRKTVYNWRSDIAASLGVLIECEMKGRTYEYYIDYSDDTKKGVRDWLISTYSVCNQLIGSLEISNRIILEEVPSGQGYFSTIVEAMRQNRMLEITYRGFGKSMTHTFPVEPYFVKLFNRRWYLVANSPCYSEKKNSIRIYGLDRVSEVILKDQHFDMPKDFDPSSYFQNYFGVDKYSKFEDSQKIKIKCSKHQSAYWDSLPVHPSQNKLEVLPTQESIYQLDLYPTYDFLQFILSQGKEVEILEPIEFRKEVAWYSEQMHKSYKIADE